jgi:hypothetical protein
MLVLPVRNWYLSIPASASFELASIAPGLRAPILRARVPPALDPRRTEVTIAIVSVLSAVSVSPAAPTRVSRADVAPPLGSRLFALSCLHWRMTISMSTGPFIAHRQPPPCMRAGDFRLHYRLPRGLRSSSRPAGTGPKRALGCPGTPVHSAHAAQVGGTACGGPTHRPRPPTV